MSIRYWILFNVIYVLSIIYWEVYQFGYVSVKINVKLPPYTFGKTDWDTSARSVYYIRLLAIIMNDKRPYT